MPRQALTIIIMLQFALIVSGASAAGGTAFIPTSKALDIATKVAKDQGYSLPDKNYFFQLLTTEDNKTPLPGFIAIEFYGGYHPLLQIAINEVTGQIVDSVSCVLFDYPDLKPFQTEVQEETGEHPLAIDQLASTIGCPSLERVFKPAHVH